jgi:hypothetical protein
VSFDGLQVDWLNEQIGGELTARYDGHVVASTKSAIGFADTIKAPGTSGNLCIARVAGTSSPVVFDYAANGACCGSTLQALYRAGSGSFKVATFGIPITGAMELAVLGGAVAVVASDIRFDFLFTDGAGSATPVQVSRFVDGRLVDVSRQFPSLIAADAKELVASTHSSWFRADGVFAFIGELNAWVADECRLGNAATAWRTAENDVAHGQYRAWMAENEPHYLEQLGSDLLQWEYCSSAP